MLLDWSGLVHCNEFGMSTRVRVLQSDSLGSFAGTVMLFVLLSLPHRGELFVLVSSCLS